MATSALDAIVVTGALDATVVTSVLDATVVTSARDVTTATSALDATMLTSAREVTMATSVLDCTMVIAHFDVAILSDFLHTFYYFFLYNKIRILLFSQTYYCCIELQQRYFRRLNLFRWKSAVGADRRCRLRPGERPPGRPAPGSEYDCRGLPDGAYGGGCRTFYRCVDGRAYYVACRRENVFNRQTGLCDR